MSKESEATELVEAIRVLEAKIGLASEAMEALKKSREEAIANLLDIFVERPLLDGLDADDDEDAAFTARVGDVLEKALEGTGTTLERNVTVDLPAKIRRPRGARKQ